MNKKHLTISSLALFFVLTVIFSLQTHAAAPTSGLISHWKFDGNAFDSSGFGNNGTLVNDPTFTTGKIGQAINLDGVDDYVSVGSVGINTGAPFTMSVWIYHQTTIDYGTIMGYDGTHRLLVQNGNDSLLSQQDGNFFSAANAVPNNQWINVVYWNDGTKERWYVNGIQSGSDHVTANAEWNAVFYLGRYDLADTNYKYKGLIDDVRIYNRALSAQEVLDIYNDTGAVAPTPTPTPATVSLTASPTSLTSGSIITVLVSGGPGNTGDWVGLYSTGAPPEDGTYIHRYEKKYLNNQTTPPATGLTSGTLTFIAPAIPFTYELRFFSSTGALLGKSNAVTITGGGTPIPTPTPTPTPATTSGIVYYVAKTGSDSYSCSQAQSATTPKLTIPGALACVPTGAGGGAGKTITIKAGSYPFFEITDYSGVAGNPFTIQGAPGESAIIDSYLDGQSGFRAMSIDGGTGINRVNYVTIRNMKFTDTNPMIDVHKDCLKTKSTSECTPLIDTYNFRTRGLTFNAVSNVIFDNIEVYHNSSQGFQGNCLSGCQLINSSLHDNGAINSGYGTYITQAEGFIIRNNIAYRNSGMGFRIGPSGGSFFNNGIIENNIAFDQNRGQFWQDGQGFVGFNEDGFLLYYGDNNIFRNNIAYNNEDVGISILGTNNKVYNNTVYKSGYSNYYPRGIVFDSGGSNNHAWNNIVYDTYGGIDIAKDSSGGTTCNNLCATLNSACQFSGNPFFVGAPSANFHLQSTSPAINKGATLSDVLKDFDGVSRPQGGAYDIGAFEYGGTVSPAPTPTPTPTPTTTTSCNYYVDPNGNDTNSGTSASSAFRTIQKAADIVIVGKTVCVQPGTYPNQVTSRRGGVAGAPVRFISTTKWGAKLSGTYNGIWRNEADYVDI